MADTRQLEPHAGSVITGEMIADVMSGTRRIDLTELEAAVEVLSGIDIPSDLDQRLAIRHPVIRGAAGHYSTKALVESGKVAELATKLADADERFGTS